MVMIMSFLSLCLWLSQRLWQKIAGEEAGTSYSKLSVSIFAVFLSFCLQGGRSPYSPSCRIVYLVSYLTSVTLLASYSASLISHITSRTYRLPFTTFEGFLLDGTFTLGVMSDTADHAFLRESTAPVISKIHKQMELSRKESFLLSKKKGLQEVCSSKNYAIFTVLYFTQNNSNFGCEFVPIPEAFFPGYVGMGVVKNSPYKRIFNYVSQEMRRAGLLKTLKKKYLEIKDSSYSIPFTSIKLTDVAPIFAILLFGIAVANVVLLTELINNH
ncbi:probable glutamate receptor [Periplaneta americana]|uniref:probable glutamate receptor n=1 Tax=Periplaneta americana TaxID=6978 RepID=UPI0037E981BE